MKLQFFDRSSSESISSSDIHKEENKNIHDVDYDQDSNRI